MDSLEAIYGELNNPLFYKRAVKKRIAKIILGSSVIRAFEKDSKPLLLNCLINLEVDTLATIKTESEYDKWHSRKITSIYNCLLKTNKRKFKKNLVGLKWGHATKVLNLYVGHLYYYSPYYGKLKRKFKAHLFFHIPLDSKVFAALKKCNVDVPKNIKTINVVIYKEIQNTLRKVAQKKRVDPLRFDEYAWAETD